MKKNSIIWIIILSVIFSNFIQIIPNTKPTFQLMGATAKTNLLYIIENFKI